MTEHREEYRTLGYIGPVDQMSAVTLTFAQYQRLVGQYHIACAVITAMLEQEGREVCPNCGYRLKADTDGAALDNSGNP